MLTGVHSIIYSTNPDADRAFFRDVLELRSVDVGGGWLIFGLPPAEVAVHPAVANDKHELYLMCGDVGGFVAHMRALGVTCGPVHDRGWGTLTSLTLPGGGTLGIYEPRHARPRAMSVSTPTPIGGAGGAATRATGTAARSVVKKATKRVVKRSVKKSAATTVRKAANKGPKKSARRTLPTRARRP